MKILENNSILIVFFFAITILGIVNKNSVLKIMAKLKNIIKYKFKHNFQEIIHAILATTIFYFSIILFSFYILESSYFILVGIISSILYSQFLRIIFETKFTVYLEHVGNIDVPKLFNYVQENKIIDGNYSAFYKFLNNKKLGCLDKKLILTATYNNQQGSKKLIEITTSLFFINEKKDRLKKFNSYISQYFVNSRNENIVFKKATFSDNDTVTAKRDFQITDFLFLEE